MYGVPFLTFLARAVLSICQHTIRSFVLSLISARAIEGAVLNLYVNVSYLDNNAEVLLVPFPAFAMCWLAFWFYY